MTIRMNLGPDSYDILVQRGVLKQAGEHLNLNRRVLIVTDEGVPADYARCLADQCREPLCLTLKQGEASKSLSGLEQLLRAMLERGFSRKDCVVAVGGGVVGDLAGFAASTYMRGIDFYNLPTTLLSQIDSSIGGKTAINFGGVKNVVGAFYQPKKVLIDPDLLASLPPRQLANGLAEAVKMALTSDEDLFRLLESKNPRECLEEIILRSLMVKKSVVEQDEKEAGLRRILNFGHTIGHGIESSETTDALYHGECVALGLLPMCGDEVRPRVRAVLEKCGLTPRPCFHWDSIAQAVSHDKKADGELLTVTEVPCVGRFVITQRSVSELMERAKRILGGTVQ